jgi:hypothetical protein
VILSVGLAAALHLDWHLARPEHHRLSLGWSFHWLATAVVFGAAGCLIARAWPGARWRLGAVVFGVAVVLAQLVEPALEVLFYQGQLGYVVESPRWAAFGRAMAAATPAYWAALWLCARRAEDIVPNIVDRVPNMFDHVRIRHTPVTEAAGIAGLEGSVYGESVPSSSGVEVIGPAPEDFAINVYVTERAESYWLAPEHVEFLDYNAGAELRIGQLRTKFVRRVDGGWDKVRVD